MHFSNFFPLFFYSASTWHFLPINSLPSFTEPCNRGNTSLRLNSALSAFGCSLMKFKAKCLVILPRGYLSNELMIIDFQFPNKKKTCSLQKKYKKRKTIKKIGEMAQAINPNSDCWECFHGIYHSLIFYTWKLYICIWHLILLCFKYKMERGGGGWRSDLLDLSNMYKPNQYVNIFPLSRTLQYRPIFESLSLQNYMVHLKNRFPLQLWLINNGMREGCWS